MMMLPTKSSIKGLEEEDSEKVDHLYRVSIATHATSAFFQIFFSWRKLLNLKIFQIIDTVLIFLNIYLMLVAVYTFAYLMDKSLSTGGVLDGSTNPYDKTGKLFFSKRHMLTRNLFFAIASTFTDADQ